MAIMAMKLKEEGYIEHRSELFGAARILDTWIEGIEKEQADGQ